MSKSWGLRAPEMGAQRNPIAAATFPRFSLASRLATEWGAQILNAGKDSRTTEDLP